MLETEENSEVEQNENNDNLSIIHTVGVVAMPGLLSSIIYFSCYSVNFLKKLSVIQ